MSSMGSKKNILIVIAIFLIGIVITGASYAYWTINSNVNKNIIFNTANNLKEYVVYDEGESKFSGNFEVTNSYNQGIHSTISLYKKSEVANLTLLATIHMNINSIGANMANSNALKWVVTSGTSSNIGSVLASGNFIGSKNDDVLDLVTNLEVTTTETFYTIWIWLDASANPSDGLSGETLDTNVWTEITQLEGEEDRFEITRVSANYQMIDATVVDSKYKVTNYAITSSNTTPSTWTSITSNDQNYVYNMPSYSASATGTYYVWFKDSANRTTSKSVVVTQIDNTAPSCTWGSWNKQSISNNETATIKITCTDNESELAVNSVTTASITKSNNNITVTDLTKTKITNGYEINITVTGTNNSGETTLTLPVNTVKNSVNLGNQSITSETINVTNTYTATFYYNNNATSGSTTVATKTASCTVSNSAGNCVVTIPTDVTGSVGTYNNAYAGLSSSTGNMTQAVAADTTSVTLSGDATYYSLYRTAVTIYKPSSTSACNTQAFYRNQWFTSTNTMAETVLSTSTTGTTNSEMTLLSGYSFMELRTASATGGNAYKVANAAKTNTTTFYGREQKTSASITFKYSNSNTGTVASTVATGTDILHCTSTSAASYVNGSVSPTVTHTAPYGTTFIGWTSTVGSMNSLTTSLTSASTTWYAVYRTDNVKVYRPSSETACTNDTLYRNAVIGSISATTYTAVLATTNTGVSNFTPTVVSG
ncbi:MAG: hypothetical protein IKI04_01220, partial [Bacilli bacterium]|nr:hypothetical protein [Bacilli bacterium]